ncbi:MAG: hypothetical protein EBZ50_07620, partial [Alphaproteobacteria bacterium]|nr:hypothetical protein [Alphaproteobacteria bacterium]
PNAPQDRACRSGRDAQRRGQNDTRDLEEHSAALSRDLRRTQAKARAQEKADTTAGIGDRPAADKRLEAARAKLEAARREAEHVKELDRLAALPSADAMRAANDDMMAARLREIATKLKGTRYDRGDAPKGKAAGKGKRREMSADQRAIWQLERQKLAIRVGLMADKNGKLSRAERKQIAEIDAKIATLRGGKGKTVGFQKADRFDVTVAIAKADITGRYLGGWASVIEEGGQPVVDTQGDVIDMEELRKAAHDYVSKAREAKAMHAGAPIGEVVESVLVDDAFAKAHGITHDKRGWWIGMNITDPKAQERVRKGEWRSFSIGGSGKRTPLAA